MPDHVDVISWEGRIVQVDLEETRRFGLKLGSEPAREAAGALTFVLQGRRLIDPRTGMPLHGTPIFRELRHWPPRDFWFIGYTLEMLPRPGEPLRFQEIPRDLGYQYIEANGYDPAVVAPPGPDRGRLGLTAPGDTHDPPTTFPGVAPELAREVPPVHQIVARIGSGLREAVASARDLIDLLRRDVPVTDLPSPPGFRVDLPPRRARGRIANAVDVLNRLLNAVHDEWSGWLHSLGAYDPLTYHNPDASGRRDDRDLLGGAIDAAEDLGQVLRGVADRWGLGQPDWATRSWSISPYELTSIESSVDRISPLLDAMKPEDLGKDNPSDALTTPPGPAGATEGKQAPGGPPPGPAGAPPASGTEGGGRL